MADGRGGLTGDAEEDGHAVKDAALDAAWVVGLCVQARPGNARLVGGGVKGRRGDEGVVVPATVYFGAEEAGADLEALDSGDESIAWPMRASSLLKAGSPRPEGVYVTVPPVLSFWSRSSATRASMRSKASASGHRTGRNSSTLSRVIVLAKLGNVGSALMASVSPKSLILPTDVTKATVSTPYMSLSNFCAAAPAATRQMVSRALL